MKQAHSKKHKRFINCSILTHREATDGRAPYFADSYSLLPKAFHLLIGRGLEANMISLIKRYCKNPLCITKVQVNND